MITYQVENWTDCVHELEPLWTAHWSEVAMNKSQIPLEPNYDMYSWINAQGQLHTLTARCDGKVIGYHVSIVRPHLHYASSLSSFTDMYYISPEHRKGMVGVRLFKEAEASLKARGVEKMFTGTKVSLDMSRIFERLGWTETERLFTKFIGD